MAIHSSTLAWKILWMEEPGRLQFMGSQRVDTTERLHFHFPLVLGKQQCDKSRQKSLPSGCFFAGTSGSILHSYVLCQTCLVYFSAQRPLDQGEAGTGG